MSALSAMELLAAWELGLAKPPVERALALAAAANPMMPVESLGTLALGQRDGQLLKLREAIFGPVLDCLTACPECGEPLELRLKVGDLLGQPPEPLPAILGLEMDGYELEFRLPNSLDLMALGDRGVDGTGAESLLERCLLSARRGGERVAVASLPRSVLEEVERRMERADPLADIRLQLSCPACGHSWQGPFDIVAFLWRELDAWAGRIMHEVYVLASAFGWSEQDVLSLSPVRRQFYLDKVGAWAAS